MMPSHFQTRKQLRTACSLVAVMVLGACAMTPKETFYTLSPATSAMPVAPAQERTSAAAYSVAVGPVRVPEIVDRPQLVVRQGANQVSVLEQHRWAQPLRAEIAQALAAGLAAQLPQARILSDRDAGSANADVRVAVDVTRFDALPGDAVVVQANWSIRTAGAAAAAPGSSSVREPVNGAGNEAIAAAFSRAVATMGADIAHAVQVRQPAAAGQGR